MEAKEEKWLESHLRDLDKRAEDYGIPLFSDFLDTAQQEMLFRIVKQLSCQIETNGGYEDAERRMASFCPPYFSTEDVIYPMVLLKISLQGAKFAKKKPQHRDYLGSILGCGLERRKIGDIILQEDGAVVAVGEEIAEYLMENLREVGSLAVEVTRFTEDPQVLVVAGKELVISVASLRLDAVIGHGFGMGRGDSADLIRAGRVQINHRPCTKLDQIVPDTAIITVRGKGRLKLKGTKGASKSGRMQILAERFG